MEGVGGTSGGCWLVGHWWTSTNWVVAPQQVVEQQFWAFPQAAEPSSPIRPSPSKVLHAWAAAPAAMASRQTARAAARRGIVMACTEGKAWDGW